MKYTKDFLTQVVLGVTSYRQLIIKLGLKETGGNYSNLKKRIKENSVDVRHFIGQGWNKDKKIPTEIEHILVENSTYSSGLPRSSTMVKDRLFTNGLKQKVCENCGISEWNDKPAPLQLHHIDGIKINNKIENLQILCANCHCQTDNHSGRNKS